VKADFSEYLKFANAVGAIVTSKYGAIESMPSYNEVQLFLEEKK
jgi:sugar/nucleoside kinase (ribokinase family)